VSFFFPYHLPGLLFICFEALFLSYETKKNEFRRMAMVLVWASSTGIFFLFFVVEFRCFVLLFPSSELLSLVPFRNYNALSQVPGWRIYAIDWLGMGRSSRYSLQLEKLFPFFFPPYFASHFSFSPLGQGGGSRMAA